jgi:FtsH-binding integral membrane protein
MRVSSRPTFSNEKKPSRDSSLLFDALGGLAALSLIVGTVCWAIGLLLVQQELVSRSLPWWWFVRVAGLLHILWSTLAVYRQKM